MSAGPFEPGQHGIPPELDDYDWEQAFSYACSHVEPVRGFDGPVAGFGRDDVVWVVAKEDGQNDGDPWVGVFLLRDGRYALVSAGCDYTGWDCQAGGAAVVAGTLSALARWGMGDDELKRLPLVRELARVIGDVDLLARTELRDAVMVIAATEQVTVTQRVLAIRELIVAAS